MHEQLFIALIIEVICQIIYKNQNSTQIQENPNDLESIKQFIAFCKSWLSLSIPEQLKSFKLLKILQNERKDILTSDQLFDTEVLIVDLQLCCLQFDQAEQILKKLKTQNKIDNSSSREVYIRLLYSQLYQMKFDRAKSLKQIYMADQLIRTFHQDNLEMRHRYTDLLVEITIQNKELIFAHYQLSKEMIFQQKVLENENSHHQYQKRLQGLEMQLRLGKFNYFMEDFVACEKNINTILQRIGEGQNFECRAHVLEFINLLCYFYVKQDKHQIVMQIVKDLLIASQDEQLMSLAYNNMQIYNIISVLQRDLNIILDDEEVLLKLKTKANQIFHQFQQNWQRDVEFYQKIDYSSQEIESDKDHEMIREFLDNLRDHLTFEKLFQSIQPDYYKEVFGQFMILLRTSEPDRLAYLMNAYSGNNT
eukprot:403368974